MKIGKAAMLNVAFTLVYGLIILTGLKQFSIWSQILDLEDVNLGTFALTASPHLLRFLVVLPALVLAHLLDLNQEYVFSVFILGLTIGIVFMISRTLGETVDRKAKNWVHYYRWVALPMFAVTFLMNGRIVIAMFGLMLLISAQVAWFLNRDRPLWRFFVSQLVGLFLLNVSSGTVMVGVICFISFTVIMPLAQYPRADRRHLPLLLVSALTLTLFSPFLAIGIIKNLDYYGGGIQGFIGMLQHGFGKILPDDIVFQSLAGVAILLWLAVVWRSVRGVYRSERRNAPIVIATFVSIPLGAFGFSTLLVGLPLWICAAFMTYRV